MPPDCLLLAADLVLAAHVLFAAFIAGGLALVWAGLFLGWGWVRHRGFRLAHAAAMALVAAESLAGVFCPLTEWEWRLRRAAGQAGEAAPSFMDRLAQGLLYQDWDEGAFTLIYLAVLALIALAFWRVPMRPRGPTPR